MSGRRSLRARVTAVDHALLAAAERRRGPLADEVATLASRLADRSGLWLAVAFALTATGERRPRTAAASGLLGIAAAATLVNGPLKFAWRRDRPPAGPAPLLPLPRTFSFPSGHSASAFAFAAGASLSLPAAAPALVPAAATVAWSRVHTGVHYPSDVAAGAAAGVVCGAVAARVVRGLRQRSVHHPDAPVLGESVPSRAVLVVNGQAGSAARLHETRAVLSQAGVTIVRELSLTDLDTDALDEAMVVSAGGDGTVGAVAARLAGTSTVLMVLPLGTSNDVARSLGIPPDPAEAAATLAHGYVAEVDAAEVDDGTGPRVFVNAATAGLNAAFAGQSSSRRLRARFGGLTYPVAAARAVRSYRPFECVLDHDGGRLRLDAVHVSVSNAPVFGGLLGMRVPGASMTDGRLDVIAVERLSPARLAYAVADTLVGRHRPVRRVHALTAARVELRSVTANHPVEMSVDGELNARLPASFRVLPGALRVVLPRA